MAYSSELLAKEADLPIIIVQDTLDKLVTYRAAGGNAFPSKESRAVTYAPRFGDLLHHHQAGADRYGPSGAENFRMDIYDEYAREWEADKVSLSAPLR